jgi:hypothetical protein
MRVPHWSRTYGSSYRQSHAERVSLPALAHACRMAASPWMIPEVVTEQAVARAAPPNGSTSELRLASAVNSRKAPEGAHLC